jgi:MFS family permease
MPQPWPKPRQAGYTLFVLTIVVMFTVLDRQVLSLMIEPVKAQFGISDTQAALLLGAAFSITYGIAGLPIAKIADTWNRRNLVAICIAFWSLATMACGLAQTYAQLFVARLAIGIGESGYGPATWSMVTDTFPRERVAFGTSMLSVGALVGTGLALLVGGGALALVAHLPVFEVPFIGVHIKPWQWPFIIVGAPGLIWALVVMSLKEPVRRGFATTHGRVVRSVDVVRYMAADWRTYVAVIGGTAMKYLMSIGSGQWLPTLFRREFGWELSRIGVTLGLITLVASPIGLLLGARLSERWTRLGVPGANLRIVFFSLCVSVPLAIIYPLIPNPYVLLCLHGTSLFVAALGTGPAVAAFQVITPNQMRAQVSSVSQFSTNVLAFALGPLIVALFTDFLFKDTHDLKYSMSLSAAILGPLTIVAVAQGLGTYARSYERTARDFAN